MKDFEGLRDPDFQARLKRADSPEDILRICQEEGYELSDSELEGIAGGGVWNHPKNCPACGKGNIYHYGSRYYCRDCGHEWDEGGW